MTVKKKLTILLIAALSICLFFAFGFQIDVSGFISKEGGNADVSLTGPLSVAASEANTALEAAQAVADEANAAVVVAKLAESAAIVAEGLLIVPPATPEEKALAVQAVVDAQAVLLAAQIAADEANAALVAAQTAADEANAALVAYAGLKTKSNEELEALQLIADKANEAYDAAVAGRVLAQEVIDQLWLDAIAANAALEEFEPGENRIRYTHIIINSNNGGSFTGDNSEGNHPDVDGDTLPFTFESEDGYDLVWLRIGNIKIPATEDIITYLESFNKKNLTIHAHFKKDKDYTPEPEITIEETGPEEDVEPEDGSGNGKGKDKEKSNNGKKNK